MYDAIVVGARCAGSPTAMLLARKGYRVLLVDRASFPSDTLSTHYIHQAGAARLKRWGLLDTLVASNCPAVREQTFDVGPFALVGAPPPADGVADAYAPRRTVLDQILLAAAATAGAEVRERFTVRELVFDGDRVTGIRSDHGIERAPIVIGADGHHSLVARAVEAPAYDTRPPLTCAYYTYFAELPTDGAELYPCPGRMIITAPTNDGRSIVIIYWPRALFDEVRSNIDASFLAALDVVPALAERVRGGERVERFSGTGDLPFFFRKPFGPGWALVGDAGYHKDPITAQGITDAFRDAELLTDAIHAGFSGDCPLADALADYERARNEGAGPMYAMTQDFGTLEPPPPEMQQLFAALRDDREQTDRFFGTVAGTVPIAEFFAPENLARIVGAATPV